MRAPRRSAPVSTPAATTGPVAAPRVAAPSVQREAEGYFAPLALAPSQVVQTLERARGGGQPLPESLRARLEPALGGSLQGTRLHTDAEADRLSRALSARAFTTGRDVYFRAGAFAPETADGMRLLQHEATHVLQQRAGPVPGRDWGGGLRVSEPGDAGERGAVAHGLGQGVAVQREGDLPLNISQGLKDWRFDIEWSRLGRTEARINEALKSMEHWVGPGNMVGYVPPPRRAPALSPVSAGDANASEETQALEGESSGVPDPNADVGDWSPMEGPFADATQESAPGDGAPDVDVKWTPLKIGGTDVFVKAGTKGAQVLGTQTIKLPPLEVPIYAGVFARMENTLVVSGGFGVKSPSWKLCGEAGLDLSSRIMLAGGTKWAHIGGGLGIRLSNKISISNGDFSPLKGEVVGSLFVTAKLKFPYNGESDMNDEKSWSYQGGVEFTHTVASKKLARYSLSRDDQHFEWLFNSLPFDELAGFAEDYDKNWRGQGASGAPPYGGSDSTGEGGSPPN